jgi:hypothetical protein
MNIRVINTRQWAVLSPYYSNLEHIEEEVDRDGIELDNNPKKF